MFLFFYLCQNKTLIRVGLIFFSIRKEAEDRENFRQLNCWNIYEKVMFVVVHVISGACVVFLAACVKDFVVIAMV